MSNNFYVTGLGLQVDKTMIMPGSTLKLSRTAPGHWSRFGSADLDEAERQMTVATPNAAVSGDKEPEDDDMAALTAQAEELGIDVDGRWSAETLQEKIDEALAA